jgi:hypothetical protein
MKYCEDIFINDFINEYNLNDEFNIKLAFDDYYYIFIINNDETYLKNVFNHYHNNEKYDLDRLYDTLYNIIINNITEFN